MSVILRPHVPPFAGTRAAPLDTSAPWEPADSGGGPWTPKMLPGIAAWFDTADPSNNVSGGVATQLTDLSGNGRHATAAGAARPPTTAEDLLNGALVARFSTTHSMTIAACPRPRAILWVGRPRSGGVDTYLAFGYGAGFVPCVRVSASGTRWGYQIAGTNVPDGVGAGLIDEYFRPLALIDDGTGANGVRLDTFNSKATAIQYTGRTTDATGRSADGLAFKLNDPSFPTAFELRALVILSQAPSAADVAQWAEYARRNYIDTGSPSRIEWVGTLSTNDEAQPRPYPAAHDAVSGQTLQGCDWLMNGVWSGTDVTIGSPGDPGAGNRGAIETLCTTQGKTDVVAVWMGPPAVETQNPDITVYYPAYERMIRRAHAVQGVGPGSIVKHYICPILPGLLAPYSDTQGGIWNTWASTTLQTDMAGFGVPTAWVDMLTGFDTVTMLRPSDQHLNWPTGDKFIAQALANKLSADGYLTGAYRLLLIGHSHVAGGSNLTPASTAQFRAWLARLMA